MSTDEKVVESAVERAPKQPRFKTQVQHLRCRWRASYTAQLVHEGELALVLLVEGPEDRSGRGRQHCARGVVIARSFAPGFVPTLDLLQRPLRRHRVMRWIRHTDEARKLLRLLAALSYRSAAATRAAWRPAGRDSNIACSHARMTREVGASKTPTTAGSLRCASPAPRAGPYHPTAARAVWHRPPKS
eukprot:scaffold84377_cov75-Phaeocystis_antarctica.AAC.4